MSDNIFNCYNFTVTAGMLPDGSFERGSLGKYLDGEGPKHLTVVFKKTQKLAVEFFAGLLAEYIEVEKQSPVNSQIASAMTVELLHHKPQGDSAGSVSFAIKYNDKPLPPLECDIKKGDRLPQQIDIYQDVADGSVSPYGFDSAYHSILWYVNRARSMAHK